VNPFEFATASRIIFGAGTVEQVAGIAETHGSHTLLVTGGQSTAAAADRLEQQLKDRKIAVTRFSVSGEPSVETIEAGMNAAGANSSANSGCDNVIALGGGSVLDTGKVLAGLLTNGGNVLDYLEVVGRGQPITKPAAPLIAIPTTAGTGTEVTRNGVIAVKDKQVKVSMRSPYLLPRVAVVDPALTHTMPKAVTASTGLDALTQLIEPYTCLRRNPMTDALALEGLRRATRSLVSAYENGDSPAREDMAFASLFGGLCLANAGLGAVHGFAGVLGGRYPIPHGVCCAALLPHVIKGNIAALRERDSKSDVLARYETLAVMLVDKPSSDAMTARLEEIGVTLNIPKLSSFGVAQDDVAEIVAQSRQASSMKANPIKLTAEELTGILTAAM